MATVNGYTAERMDEIVADNIIAGQVDENGDLILETRGGTPINAGSVVGPQGETGPPGSYIETGDIVSSFRTSKAGFLLCDGSLYARATYSDLADELGVDPGATNFNVPDLRNRTLLGAGGSISPSVGGTGGQQEVVLTTAQMPTHNHANTGVESASHIHAVNGNTNVGSADHIHTLVKAAGVTGYIVKVAESTLYLNAGASGAHGGAAVSTATELETTESGKNHTHPVAINTGTQSANHVHGVNNAGSGQAHNNLQPYMGVNYFIKT